MDSDDPEQRIAELEGRLGRGEQAYPPMPPPMAQPMPAPGVWADTAFPAAAAGPAAPAPGYSAAASGFRPQPPSAPRRMWPMVKNALFGVGAVGLTLFLLGVGAYHVYAYQVGTPTTATVTECHTHGKSGRECSGTWKIDGTSQSGKIAGEGDDYRVGQALDVRVRDGRAYTPKSSKGYFIAGSVVGVLTIVFLWSMRPSRKRRR